MDSESSQILPLISFAVQQYMYVQKCDLCNSQIEDLLIYIPKKHLSQIHDLFCSKVMVIAVYVI